MTDADVTIKEADADPVVFDPVALIGRIRKEAARVERLRDLIDTILDYSAFTHVQQIEYRRRADAIVED